jgi:type I restriction enzyme R subunit
LTPKPPHAGFASALAGEEATVEQPTIALLAELGWQTANLRAEQLGPANPTGRLSFREVVLPARLRAALAILNPTLPAAALADAISELTRDRATMLPVAANREVWRLLRQGVPVRLTQPDGESEPALVRLIDWTTPAGNDFLLAAQPWFHSALYKRRPDLVGFVNGIPLLLIECKAPNRPLAGAFDDNLRDYRDTIPALFPLNGFVVLTNGIEARMGAAAAPYVAFAPWPRLTEDAPDSTAPETLLRAACAPARLLDMVENFTVFEEERTGLVKKLARYHQVLGVNRAIGSVRRIGDNAGRLGVVWHTQGSGKSLSMVFFTEKLLRTQGNNWTFVIVTDRTELDDQIAATYAATGALTRTIKEAQAQSRADLRRLLAGQERYVFTLIHKFGTERGELMEVLSDRADIIVITDEAHRSQYDTLALNMRAALPNAAFLGFTGTPLIAGGSQRTREVFGDYVSVYDFAQSIADGATVPLFYDERKPELHLRDGLREEWAELVEEIGLEDEDEATLQKRFARQHALITNPDRQDKIAADLARHFAARGYRGKAMFVAIDKAAAVAMYDRVRVHWAALIQEQEGALAAAPSEAQADLAERLAWMRTVDMAVVVSAGQNEIADLAARGLDIRPHRERMQSQDLAEDFKRAEHPLSLVFVCAMWITGFDVPTCSTMYLDKPLRQHTLMQTIARANRRAQGKQAGVIVDYVGVFANLQRALAVYASPRGSDAPIQDMAALVAALESALADTEAAAEAAGADLAVILTTDKAQRAARIGAAADALVAPDERRRAFLRLSDAAVRAYKAVLPDNRAVPFFHRAAVLAIVADALRGMARPADLAAYAARIEALLHGAILGASVTAPLRAGAADGLLDLSGLDFDRLGELFAGRPHAAAEAVREAAEAKACAMAAANPTRADLVGRLEELVAAYNAATLDAEAFLARLKVFCAELDEEAQRHAREGLSEAELAIFDLLTRPEPKLTQAQEVTVKAAARSLMGKLQDLLAVRDWHLRQQPRAAVMSAIRVELNTLPEDPYPLPLWEGKVEDVWQFVATRYGAAVPPSACA